MESLITPMKTQNRSYVSKRGPPRSNLSSISLIQLMTRLAIQLMLPITSSTLSHTKSNQPSLSRNLSHKTLVQGQRRKDKDLRKTKES